MRRSRRPDGAALRLWAALLALSATLAAQPGVRPAAPPDVDAWVTGAMAAFEVPGLALAIVKDDQVVFAKGCGGGTASCARTPTSRSR